MAALLVCVAGGWFSSACGDDGGRADAGDAVESFVIALEATIDVDCECQRASSQDCASLKQSLRQCVNDAVANDPMASRQFPACAVPATRDYNACLRARAVCGADGIEGVEECVADIQALACEIPAGVHPCLSGSDAAPGVGPAPVDTPGPDTPEGVCSDRCVYDGRSVADDGECDDGGPDAEYDVCELGTDCTDCGPR